MKKFKHNNSTRKNRFKFILKLIGIVMLCGAFSVASVNIYGAFNRELNPDNLIDVNGDGYIKSQNTARGVKIEVDDDGIIKLSGKATSSGTVTVSTVELQPGTYTLSGVENPNIDKFGMRVQYGSGDVAFADTESATFEITATETVSVIIYWADGYSFNVFTNNKVMPVLVSGSNAGSYYK